MRTDGRRTSRCLCLGACRVRHPLVLLANCRAGDEYWEFTVSCGAGDEAPFVPYPPATWPGSNHSAGIVVTGVVGC